MTGEACPWTVASVVCVAEVPTLALRPPDPTDSRDSLGPPDGPLVHCSRDDVPDGRARRGGRLPQSVRSGLLRRSLRPVPAAPDPRAGLPEPDRPVDPDPLRRRHPPPAGPALSVQDDNAAVDPRAARAALRPDRPLAAAAPSSTSTRPTTRASAVSCRRRSRRRASSRSSPVSSRWSTSSSTRREAHGDVDVVRDLAFPLPFAVISELLGMPEADRVRLREVSHSLVKLLEPIVAPDEIPGLLESGDRMDDHVARRSSGNAVNRPTTCSPHSSRSRTRVPCSTSRSSSTR